MYLLNQGALMQVGDTVTLRVRNPLYNSRSIYSQSVVINEYNNYSGQVITNPSWVGPDCICLTTGLVDFPFRILSKEDIILENTEESQVKQSIQSAVWEILGSNGRPYLVTQNGSHWSCSCVGYGFRRSCTHVNQAKAKVHGGDPKLSNDEKIIEKKATRGVYKPKNTKYYVKVSLERGNPAPIDHEVTMTKVTKNGQIIDLMNKNASLPMAKVVELIAAKVDVSPARARAYYGNFVRKGLAKGAVDKTRAAKPKAEKPAKAAKATEKLEKSVDEIARIKAKNLETMRAVTAKTQKRVARPEGAGVPNFDPELARAQVAKFIETGDHDSFEKLTMADLKAMI